MNVIDAIDIFVETDPTDDSAEGSSLISVRAPHDREFAQQLKELGGKWEEATKEWKLYGNDTLLKEVANLCRSAFPRLPRRRNRLVSFQLTTSYAPSTHETAMAAAPQAAPVELEQTVRVEFVVNRTVKSYRLGQSLKWFKEFKEFVEVAPDFLENAPASAPIDRTKLNPQLQTSLPELEATAIAAFEALVAGQKDSARKILTQAGIEYPAKF